MSTRTEVLKLLADGSFHSGTDLGRVLGISRAAVCKNIKSLSHSGLTIHRVSGRGYRLESFCTPLDVDRIRTLLRDTENIDIDLQLLDQVDSTNRYLLEAAASGRAASGSVCVTEAQTRGRGRRGRSWVATPYSNVMLSMLWRFDSGPDVVAGLSLAAGVAVAKALQDYGITGIGLKWPNDIVWQRVDKQTSEERTGVQKLAGVLIDVQGEATGPSVVVLGIGINVYIAAHDGEAIDQSWVDLAHIIGGPVDRNRLATAVIGRLHQMLCTFEQLGLAAFRDEWERLHVYSGQTVQLHHPGGTRRGIATGIDSRGALLVRNPDGAVQAYHSGEISMRPTT
jgi:BirA family biotin operon repressor/biotin-[acetyl-CoA-carboxylase] ligase